MILRREQLQHVQAGLYEAFVSRLMAHFAALWPEQVAMLGETYRGFIEYNIQHAIAYGIDSERPIARFLNLYFVFGAYFENRPEHEWAMRILNDPSLRGAVKVHQLTFQGAAQCGPSDAAAKEAFGDRPVSATVQACAAAMQYSVPCDIDDVVLYEIPAGRAISLTGVSGVPSQRALEVVGDAQIRAYIHPFATHDESHVQVTVLRPGESPLEQRCQTLTDITFDVRWARSMAVSPLLLVRMFPFQLTPNRYRVTVESCGVRNAGSVHTGGALSAVVYPPDQYALTVAIPALGSGQAPAIQLQQNGYLQDVTANTVVLANALRQVELNVQRVPGTISATLLTGHLWMTAGFREFADHRACFVTAGQITMTVFSVTLEVGMDVQAGAAFLRLDGEIEPTTLAVDASWDIHDPDEPLALPDTAQKADFIPLVLRGEAAAGWWSARVSSGGMSGFNAEGGARLNSFRNFELFGHVHWNGIHPRIVTASPTAGEEEEIYHYSEAYDICTGAVPI